MLTPCQRGAMPLRPGNEATTSPEALIRWENAKCCDLSGAASGRVTHPADLGIDHVMPMTGGPRVVPDVTLGALKRRAVRRRVGPRPGVT
jgi:hypothetical protein